MSVTEQTQLDLGLPTKSTKVSRSSSKPTTTPAKCVADNGSYLPSSKIHRSTKKGSYVVANDDNYKWLPDGSVDFVLTDPPFNIARDTNFHTYEKNTVHSYRFDEEKGWDTYGQEEFIKLLHDWSREFSRVLRKGGTFAVFCADAYVSHLIDALRAAGLSPKRVLTWRKPNAVPVNRKSLMMSACEYVIVGVKGSKGTFNADIPLSDLPTLSEVGAVIAADKAAAVTEQAVREALRSMSPADLADPAKASKAVSAAVASAASEAAKRVKAMYVSEDGDHIFRACIPNHVAFNSKAGNRLHPTEKPVPLLEYLISIFSRPGDIVLDAFGGSGSTGEAALRQGRQAVVVEMDPAFYSKIVTRLKALR